MNNVTRLRDDASLPTSLRQALEAEDALPSFSDPRALRSAVVSLGSVALAEAAATKASGGIAGTVASVQTVVGFVAATTLLFGGGYLLLGSGAENSSASPAVAAAVELPPPPRPAREAEPIAPAAVAEPSVAEPEAPAAEPAVLEVQVEPGPRPRSERPRSARAERPAAPAAAPVALPAPEPLSPADEIYASALAEELQAYRAGQRALKRGRHTRAIAAFDGYLSDFPDGALRIEAQLSLLEALIRGGRHDRGAELAARLSADPEFYPRRGELLRVQADGLVQRGECVEAAVLYRRAITLARSGLTQEHIDAALARCEADAR